MNPLWGQDEFGWGVSPVVDEEDDKSRDEQCGDDNGCEECAFGHGFYFIIITEKNRFVKFIFS